MSRTLLTVLAFSALLNAQTSSLSGVVRDVSGAVITGAVVQAAASTLSEKVHTVVTDSQGRYRIELNPGRYVVTAVAQGFAPEKQAVEIIAASPATVDAVLKVAAGEASLTISADDGKPVNPPGKTKSAKPKKEKK